MKLAPIMEHLKKSKGLDINCDVWPTWLQLKSIQYQILIVIVHVLTKYSKHFTSYAKHPALQHKARHVMPDSYITKQYPIWATTIEEATVQGNLLFHEDVYLTQLKHDPDDLSKYTIPTFNDQLTNLCIHSGKILRARDLNPWTQWQVFQLGFSVFHLCLNLVWGLLHIHRGTLEQSGSLVYIYLFYWRKLVLEANTQITTHSYPVSSKLMMAFC
jgi:hypothetical protein